MSNNDNKKLMVSVEVVPCLIVGKNGGSTSANKTADKAKFDKNYARVFGTRRSVAAAMPSVN